MIFQPHTLHVFHESKPTFDDEGHLIFTKDSGWIQLCKCRCDDNNTTKQISVNGQLYNYSYHIVYQGAKLESGTKVKCLDKDGAVRGEGEIVKCNKTNCLNYTEIWV